MLLRRTLTAQGDPSSNGIPHQSLSHQSQTHKSPVGLAPVQKATQAGGAPTNTQHIKVPIQVQVQDHRSPAVINHIQTADGRHVYKRTIAQTGEGRVPFVTAPRESPPQVPGERLPPEQVGILLLFN